MSINQGGVHPGVTSWYTWGIGLGTVLVALVISIVLHRVVIGFFRRVGGGHDRILFTSFAKHQRRPLGALFPLVAVSASAPALPLPHELLSALLHALGLGIIASIAWAAVAMMGVYDDLLFHRYAIDVADNLLARTVRTRFVLVQRIIIAIVAVVTASIMLMTFPSVQHIGASLLASAGLTGLIAGLAARPALENLIAGIQVAFTQPIRIEDVVIVDGEWGWVEEIRTTYVVVRIWDLRRLIVPLSYFIDKPFQNWTRTTADLLGTVLLYLDYSVPIDELRRELHAILERSGMWDGKAWGLQVTDANPTTIEVRALMSAPNAGTSWDLRCHVREQMIAFLRERYPQCLPYTRVDLREDASAVRQRHE